MVKQISVREKAFALRAAGYSYSHISLQTGVSKSTLSGWLAKVPYIPNAEVIAKIGKARSASGARVAKIKQESLALARKEALKEVGNLSKRDIFMFGLGLYLGEGSKTNDITRIVNSDSRVIKFAMAWFESLGIPKDNFVIRVHLYPDSDTGGSIKYWMNQTGLQKWQFLKPQIDWRKNKKAYKLGKLPHGTAHLSVKGLGEKRYGSFLSRKILAWIDEMAEKLKADVV